MPDPKLIYLASAYSHESATVRRSRYESAVQAAAGLMGAGLLVFSPIAHSHPIAVVGDLGGAWEHWQAFDRRLMSTCDELWILSIPGWSESEGIAAEIEIAYGYDMLVRGISERDACAGRIDAAVRLTDLYMSARGIVSSVTEIRSA